MDDATVRGELTMLDLLLKVLPSVLTSLLSKFIDRIPTRQRRPLTEIAQSYLTAFLGNSRSPRWDPGLLNAERLKRSQLHYAEQHGDGGLSGDDIALPRRSRSKVITVERFLDRLLLSGLRSNRARRVFVILGPPASGKSVVAVQIAQLLATRAEEKQTSLIPVYVNLIHFGKERLESDDGFLDLLRESVDMGCPRYMVREHSAHPAPGTRLSSLLEAPENRFFFIFDGIDEMPVGDSDAGEHNRKLQRMAAFISNNAQHVFVLTCRLRDYSILRDHSANFSIVRYELDRWTDRMFERYLKSRRVEAGAGADALLNVLRRIRSTPLWGQFRDSPFLAALLFAEDDYRPARTLSEGWRRFLETYLRPHLGGAKAASETSYADALASLEDFAFATTLRPLEPYVLDACIKADAVSAGIVADVRPNPVFVIKPLQHYFAAQHLWHRILDAPTTYKLGEVTHAKLRVTFVLMMELAGDHDEARLLCHRMLDGISTEPASLGEVAGRFELICSCLRESHFQDSELVAKLVDHLEAVIHAGDPGDLDKCAQGIERHPDLLAGERALDLVVSVCEDGSIEAKRRLFRMILKHPRLICRLPFALWNLSMFFARRAMLGSELVEALRERMAAGSRDGGIGFGSYYAPGALRLGLLGVYLYCIYMVGLKSGHAAFRGLGKLGVVPWDYLEPVPFVPDSAPDAAVRGAMILAIVVLPWLFVTRLARADVAFRSGAGRLCLVLAIAIGLRTLLLTPAVGVATVTYASSVLEFGVLGLILAIPIFFGALLLLARLMPAAASHARSPISVDTTPIRVPPHLIVFSPQRGYIRRLLARTGVTPQELQSLVRRRWRSLVLGGSMLGAVLVLIAAYRVQRLAVVVGAIAVAIAVMHRLVLAPYVDYRRIQREVEMELKRRQSEPEKVVIAILFQRIASPELLLPLRRGYLRLLVTRIRWDSAIVTEARRLASNKGLHPMLRLELKSAISRKAPEVDQNSNPEWDEQELKSLFNDNRHSR